MRILVAVTAALACATMLTPAPSRAQDDTTAKIVEIMRTLSGNQKARPSGAKGQCFTASFQPSADAPRLTRSAMFTGPVPAIVRFSVGGGNPKVADGTKTANRGMSIRFDPTGDGTTEFVMINAPVNFVRSPEQMLGFLQARLPGPDGKPDPAKIKAFADANPETANQGKYLAAKPVPASWVGVPYWAIHPYTLTNEEGAVQVVKFKMVPLAGELGLSDEEAKAKPTDFLVDELKGRLDGGAPASFDMVAILGTAEDAKIPPTQQWPNEDMRETARLGTLTITGLEPNATCDEQIFDPTALADGIAGPDDPLFLERQPAYAISISERN